MIDMQSSLLPKREILTSQKGTDGRWHGHYPTASQTLCGRAVLPSKPGRRWLPDCGVCSKVARAFDRIDSSCPPPLAPRG